MRLFAIVAASGSIGRTARKRKKYTRERDNYIRTGFRLACALIFLARFLGTAKGTLLTTNIFGVKRQFISAILRQFRSALTASEKRGTR